VAGPGPGGRGARRGLALEDAAGGAGARPAPPSTAFAPSAPPGDAAFEAGLYGALDVLLTQDEAGGEGGGFSDDDDDGDDDGGRALAWPPQLDGDASGGAPARRGPGKRPRAAGGGDSRNALLDEIRKVPRRLAAPPDFDTCTRDVYGAVPGLRFTEGDLATAALPPCAAVVFYDVLHHLRDAVVERVLAAAYDRLAPGGVVVETGRLGGALESSSMRPGCSRTESASSAASMRSISTASAGASVASRGSPRRGAEAHTIIDFVT
jgi:hypothetical protein